MYPPVGAVPGQAMLISARADAVALTSLVIWCLGERSESRSKRVRADRRKLRRPADDRAAATEINGAPSAKGPAHLARALCSPGVRSVPARASDCSSRLRAKICALPILFVQRHRSNKSSRFVVHQFLRVCSIRTDAAPCNSCRSRPTVLCPIQDTCTRHLAARSEEMSMPLSSENQVRTWWWCSPDEIGTTTMTLGR
jgi:hypothetical protein